MAEKLVFGKTIRTLFFGQAEDEAPIALPFSTRSLAGSEFVNTASLERSRSHGRRYCVAGYFFAAAVVLAPTARTAWSTMT